MKKSLSLLAGWIGFILFLGGLVILGINPAWRMASTVIEVAALLLLGYFFLTHFEAVKTFSTRRSTKFGLNSLLMVVLFISIIGILNFLSSRHSQRMDLSETARFTLAPQTQKILNDLNREVRITAFTESQSPNESEIMDLLDSYAHETEHINFKVLDPAKKPAIANQYGVTQYGTLVLESGSQETRITNATEQELTNALIRVTKDQQRKVFFLEGHGEHDLTDTDREGFSKVKNALEKQGYQVEALSLLQTGKVPHDASVLVIAGPKRALLPQEIEALSDFMDGKGKILALLDPQVEANMGRWLETWGIQLGPGVIVDSISRLFGGDLTVPIVTTYPFHDITREFDLATFYPVAQRVQYQSPGSDFEFQALAKTTENSWSKLDLQGNIDFDPQTDTRGPLTIGGIVTRGSPEPSLPDPAPQTPEEKETPDSVSDQPMLAVFGDSDFATNGFYQFSGNGDLFLNTINFLAQEKDLIAITAKKPEFSPLFLSSIQGNAVMYTSVFIMPGIVILTGFLIWRRRRRL